MTNTNLSSSFSNTGQKLTLIQSHQIQKFYNVGLNGLISLRDYQLNRLNPGITARRKAIDALNQLAINSSDPFSKHAGLLFEEGLDMNLRLQSALASVPDLSDRFSQDLSEPHPNGRAFAASLARAAELITIRKQLKMRRQIFFVELSGFDTHSEQTANHGVLSESLSTFLKAFSDVIKDSGLNDSVLTVTTSEFGRNLVSNGDGTDHGWGAQHMVMGGPVDGKKMYGTYPSLELNGPDDYNGLSRMIPTTSISQYGATIADWFGVPASRIDSVFPNIKNFSNSNIGFIA